MKSWIDSCMVNDDIWLVLVFHGVDGVGWEAIPGDTLDLYFDYIKANEEDLWVATFQDVTKYMRERMNSTVNTYYDKGQIDVELAHDLDPGLYDLPLTLKTKIPDRWEKVSVSQNGLMLDYKINSEKSGKYIVYSALPGTKVRINRSGANF